MPQIDILYPYNESLPKKTAHDVHLFRHCASLSDIGLSVRLACGWGGWGNEALLQHYGVHSRCPLTIQKLPLLRRWGICYNKLFFWSAQRLALRHRPRWLVSSVFKQAAYHAQRRIPAVRYAYEVHQLSWYPNCDDNDRRSTAEAERRILAQMDLVTVTTEALKRILCGPPYSLSVPIEVVPLAMDCMSLPPAPNTKPFTAMYVGQLYPSQGVDLLLRAVRQVPDIALEVIGGKSCEVAELKALSSHLGIADRVRFHGFLPPQQIPEQVARAHALVAPFYAVERMPYVAHTKILEYVGWGRPVIAPKVDVVVEQAHADFLFIPGDLESLADALRQAMERPGLPTGKVMSWRDRSVHYSNILSRYSA